MKKAKFESKKTVNISTCGVNTKVLENYFQKKKYLNFKFVSPEESDYIIMTNRITFFDLEAKNFDPIICFDKFKGDDIIKVKRNGLVLSVARKILKK